MVVKSSVVRGGWGLGAGAAPRPHRRVWLLLGALCAPAASASAQAVGDWLAGPVLATARADHAMALSSGGELVVVGGEGAAGLLSTVEVLDPGASSWRAGAGLPGGARLAGAAAVTLTDGRILVVGGRVPGLVSGEILSSNVARIYDAATDTWTNVASMGAARMRHTATLLADGRVLVVGGLRRIHPLGQNLSEAPLGTAEVFDPSTGQWTVVGALASTRVDHAATLLADGRVLVVGADNGAGGLVAASDLFDPATGMWTRLAGPLYSDPRAVLSLDAFVYAGPASGALRRFDATANTWNAAASGVPLAVTGGAAALLADGSIVYAGGRTGSPLVDAGASRFVPPATVSALGTAASFPPRERTSAVRMPSGAVWVVGGARAGVPTADVRVLMPEPALDLTATAIAGLPSGRALDRAVALPDGRWLLVGFEGPSVVHDPTTNRWTDVGVGGGPGAAVVTLAGGKVMAVGGGGTEVGALPITNTALFDPATSTWSTLPPLTFPRGFGTATRLGDGRVLVVGGNANQAQAEIYDPEAETWRLVQGPPVAVEGAAAVTLGDGRVVVSGGASLGGAQSGVFVFDSATETWASLPSLPGPRAYHSMIVLPTGELMVAGGSAGGPPLTTTALLRVGAAAWVAGPALPYQSVGDLALLPTGEVFWRGGRAGEQFTAPGLTLVSSRTAWRPLSDAIVEPRGRAAYGVRLGGDMFVTGGYDANSSRLASGFTLAWGPARGRLPSVTVPAQVGGAGPLTLTGVRLLAPTTGSHGRPSAAASNVASARLFSLDGARTWPLRPRAATARTMTVDVPGVPVGFYTVYVNSLGGWTGAITRIGNTTPVARGATLTTAEDTDLTVRLRAGDRDGDSLSYTVIRQPTRGSLRGTPPDLVYVPNTNLSGPDSFAFRVRDGLADSTDAVMNLTVTPVNDAPVGVDDTYRTPEDQPLIVSAVRGVLANDTDVDSPTLRVDAASVVLPQRGMLQLSADGSFTYTPARDYAGEDAFGYRVTDGALTSAVVRVALTIEPVDDQPVAVDDQFALDEDVPLRTTVATSVLANDRDVEAAPLSAAVAEAPQHGTLMLAADGTFRYEPDRDFHGEDTFRYTASDGTNTSSVATVRLEVRPINDTPASVGDDYLVSSETGLTVTATQGVLVNDVDVDGDRLSAALVASPREGTLQLELDGSFRYDPRPGFEGLDDFSYQAFDGLARAMPVTVRLDVRAGRPIGAADTYSTREDEPLSVDRFRGVLANDEGRGRPLEATLEAQGRLGRVSLRADGSFEYVPSADASGVDTFRYRASNGLFDTGVVEVTVEILPVNDPPTVPRLLEPFDGARLASGALTFGWEASRDVDDTTLIYTLEVFDDGGRPVRSLFAAETFLSLSGTDALAPGAYTWQVVATDGRSLSSEPSAARRLVVGTEPGEGEGEGGADGGCGCATTRSSARGELLLGMLGLMLMWTRGRRR